MLVTFTWGAPEGSLFGPDVAESQIGKTIQLRYANTSVPAVVVRAVPSTDRSAIEITADAQGPIPKVTSEPHWS